MKKKKQKPDFSKPKPVKAAETELLAQDGAESGNEALTDERQFDPEKTYYNLPLIVIAGRPNVGKSTLFNALTHSRKAITDPTPGVTRDPVEGTCFLAGKPVHLMDTGGYKLTRDLTSRESEMDDLVVAKTVEMIKKADRILLLLDAKEMTSEDEELIIQMRPYWDKLIAAVNKTEGRRNEALAYEYARFGFKELLLISASHGDGLRELSREMVAGLDFSRVTDAQAQYDEGLAKYTAAKAEFDAQELNFYSSVKPQAAFMVSGSIPSTPGITKNIPKRDTIACFSPQNSNITRKNMLDRYIIVVLSAS